MEVTVVEVTLIRRIRHRDTSSTRSNLRTSRSWRSKYRMKSKVKSETFSKWRTLKTYKCLRKQTNKVRNDIVN